MASIKALVFLVALLASAVFSVMPVSADFGERVKIVAPIEVNEIDAFQTQDISFEAGETIPIRVRLKAFAPIEDVRVVAEVAGYPDLRVVSGAFSVVEGGTYTKVLTLKMPESLDEEDLKNNLDLFITVESKDEGLLDSFGIDLILQREQDSIEILDVDMQNEVAAGDILTFDVVVKNRGLQQAEDTFVVVRIPALKLEDRAYFGDLTPMDQGGDDLPEEEDSRERRLSLRIPSNTPVGVYVVEIEASTDDASITITKKVAVSGGAEEGTRVIAPVHSKSFDAGESAEYSIVIVNSGNKQAVFELVIDAPSELSIDVSEPVVAIPAGSSKTVKLEVSAEKEGTYNFAANIHSGTELVDKEEFSAKVGGKEVISGKTNPTVLLTVILAIIFVVLLIVLIVLLTRKPIKTEETGESYY